MLMPPTSPLCKSSSSQTSMLPTCIARCLLFSPADTYSRSTLCCQPNPSSALHLSNLLSCSEMSTGQASAGMLKLSQPELGAFTLMLGIYFGLFRLQYVKQLGMHTFIQNMSDLSEHVWKAAGLQHANATDLPLVQVEQLANINVAHMHCTLSSFFTC